MLCSSMVAKSIGGGSKLQMSNLWIRCWFIYYRQLLRLSHRWPGPKFFLCSKIKKKCGIITSSYVSCNFDQIKTNWSRILSSKEKMTLGNHHMFHSVISI